VKYQNTAFKALIELLFLKTKLASTKPSKCIANGKGAIEQIE
jgi:hypothetical protein